MSNSFWENTYKHNIAKMIGVCCRYTQNRQTAEDLAHDAFLVAIDKVSSFENKGPFEAWLRRIVVNVALQYLREQKKHKNLDECSHYQNVYEDLHEDHLGNERFTFSEAELLEVISFLPDHHRLVFNLYIIDNFSHAQIAAQLGISEGTSKSHLARARKKVRALLDQKLKENRARKKTWLPFLLSWQLWNMDHFIAGKLSGLSIPTQAKFSLEAAYSAGPDILQYKPSAINSKIYMKTGIAVISMATMWVCISNLPFGTKEYECQSRIHELQQSIPGATSGTILQALDENLFSNPAPATISDNSIIVEKTKTEEEMKNLKTLGELLIAGLSIDTAKLTPKLPVTFSKLEVVATNIPQQRQEAQRIKSNAPTQFGTFYASRVFWSDVSRKIFLKGDRVKVNLNTQKFTGSGTFSFIAGVDYVVIDGKSMQLNETVELTDKKYSFTQLLPADAVQKYGDKGRTGAVEISLAE